MTLRNDSELMMKIIIAVIHLGFALGAVYYYIYPDPKLLDDFTDDITHFYIQEFNLSHLMGVRTPISDPHKHHYSHYVAHGFRFNFPSCKNATLKS